MIVISSFHPLDAALFDLPGDLHIVYKGYKNRDNFEQSGNKGCDWEPNIGSNIFTMMRFISENYYRLPERVTFLKSNIFSRHISFEEFLPLFNKKDEAIQTYHSREIKTCASSWMDGKWYCEIYNEWFRNKFAHVRFQTAEAMYHELLSASKPSHFRFSPGGNISVQRSLIRSRSVEFYYDLTNILGGAIWPREAHIVERMLADIFLGFEK
jgi:hypothetical protein